MAAEKLRIGVDVGGTNTDAAVLCGNSLVGWAKVLTTPDVTSGVADAIRSALKNTKPAYKDKEILQVSIGTTHFVNAVIQRKSLVPVAILRLCGPASHSLPPLCEFPEDLAKVVFGLDLRVQGGYQFDGQPIVDVDEDEIIECTKRIQNARLKNVVVSGNILNLFV
jgi:N-methylhydantoinase A/oxoprolinase/acetone carboxylase beta subunit